jgi:hydrogenase small subunit
MATGSSGAGSNKGRPTARRSSTNENSGGITMTQGGAFPAGPEMGGVAGSRPRTNEVARASGQQLDWRQNPLDPMAPIGIRSRAVEPDTSKIRLGPLEKVYVIWMVGASCDGCSVAATGATHPRLEHLLGGIIPGLPRVELIHTVVSVECGPEWTHNLFMAERGELDAPYVICWEGSVMDESIAGEGYWMGLGEDPQTGRQITSLEWLDRLSPGAAAVVAVGTCASWGGIPASKGNPTNAMGVMDYLGKDFRSAFGVPVVNVPGCAPIGDNVIETAAAVLLFLNGLAPLPEFDELGRPAWLFGETVHRHCPRAGYYEEGVFAKEYGDKECLVELGCWGPVVQCNIAERGNVDGHGGCMNMGGICIGCTMPGFPDKFSPIYEIAPGSLLSSTTSKMVGGFIRKMRYISREDKNLTARWEQDGPSGFGRAKTAPSGVHKTIQKFYSKYQHSHEGGHGGKRTYGESRDEMGRYRFEAKGH